MMKNQKLTTAGANTKPKRNPPITRQDKQGENEQPKATPLQAPAYGYQAKKHNGANLTTYAVPLIAESKDKATNAESGQRATPAPASVPPPYIWQYIGRPPAY